MLNKLIGRILRMPAVRDRLYAAARRDPDLHIGPPGDIYMYRYWLFNRITGHKRKYNWLPLSIRIHHIVRPDADRHLHDHPFEARTWVMAGGYTEIRREELDYSDEQYNRMYESPYDEDFYDPKCDYVGVEYTMREGDSARLGFEQYHRITGMLAPGAALTFFVIGRYRGTWGFLVDGVKVAWHVYLNAQKG